MNEFLNINTAVKIKKYEESKNNPFNCWLWNDNKILLFSLLFLLFSQPLNNFKGLGIFIHLRFSENLTINLIQALV